MGIKKSCTSGGQFVHVRGMHLSLIPLHEPHPVTQIINGNKKNVGLLRRSNPCNQGEAEDNDAQISTHGIGSCWVSEGFLPGIKGSLQLFELFRAFFRPVP